MTTLETGNHAIELANLYHLLAILDRMYVRIDQTKGTVQPKIITVVNDNLFRLSTLYYGNADQWGLIAAANHLSDPEIEGIKSLVIPEWDGNDRGGIIDA